MLTRRQVLGGLGQSLVLAAGVGLGSGCKPPAKVPLVKAGMYQNTPEELARFQAAESARWKHLIETRKITAD